MNASRRVGLASALLGLTWAGLAWCCAGGMLGRGEVGGFLAAPWIGWSVGRMSVWVWRHGLIGRVFLSLLTLYVAAATFGLAIGLWDAFTGSPARDLLEVLLQSFFAIVWGMTMTGWVLLFWPLAYASHWGVVRYELRTRHR